MFCMKCGKKLENPGICRSCGADNGVRGENNYFKSPEIELLLRDDEDFQFMKENSVFCEDAQQKPGISKYQPAVNADLTGMNINPAMSARVPVSVVPSAPKSGDSVTEKIPVQNMVTGRTVSAEKPAASEVRQAEGARVNAAASCQGRPVHPKGKKTHGSLRVGRIAGLVIAALAFGIIIGILCGRCSKNKDDKKDKSSVSEVIIESSSGSTIQGDTSGSSTPNESSSEPEESSETTEITTGTYDEKTFFSDKFNRILEEFIENSLKIVENKDDTPSGEQYYQ